MEQIPGRLVEIASARFMKDGYSRVTTDEIAYEAGMSKKTLYRYFPGKKELFSFVVGLLLRQIEERIEKLLSDSSSSSLEKITGLFRIVAERASKISRALMQDFARTVPEEWKRIDDFRRKMLLTHLKELLHKGKEEGSIREDLDLDLLVQILFQIVTNTFVPEVFGEFPYPPVMVVESLINLIHRGVLTEEGRKRFGNFTAKKI
jgi:AcrR family transcriptional regulator